MNEFLCLKDLYEDDFLICKSGERYLIRDMQDILGESEDGYCEIHKCGMDGEWVIEKTWSEIEDHFEIRD